MIRKMLRIDHARSGISCGSKTETAGFLECKCFESRILRKTGGEGEPAPSRNGRSRMKKSKAIEHEGHEGNEGSQSKTFVAFVSFVLKRF